MTKGQDAAPPCICVFGSQSPDGVWLAQLQAHWPDALIVLVGHHPPHDDYIYLDAAAGNDPLTLLDSLAEGFPGRDLLLVRSNLILPARALERLQAALVASDVHGVMAMDDASTHRSPLPPSMSADALLLDQLCHSWGERLLLPANAHDALLSLWSGACLAARTPHEPLEAALLDHLYVGMQAQSAAPDGARGDDNPPPSPLQPLRQRIGAALTQSASGTRAGLDARPVILHVLHGWGGGAERFVRDLAAGMTSAHHLVLMARGNFNQRQHGQWLELHNGSLDGPPLRRIALPRPISDTVSNDAGYRTVLTALRDAFAPDAVIVSSLIGHSLDVLRTGLPTVYVIHDHYPLWPALHRDFGDRSLAFDAQQRRADLAVMTGDSEFAAHDADYWLALRHAFIHACVQADVKLVAPSRSALDNHLHLGPALRDLPAEVIPHGMAPWPALPEALCAPRPARPRLRLLIAGRVRRGKGADLLWKALPQLREHAEMFLAGAGSDAQMFFGEPDVHIMLDYERDELPQIVARLAPDAALLLPTVAETFSYALSELRSLGLPVIATRIGALAERISDGVDGFLVDPNAQAIAERIAALHDDGEALQRVRQHLATIAPAGLDGMQRAWQQLLPLAVHAHDAAPRGITTTDLMLADNSTQLQAARQQLQNLRVDLDEARTQGEQRGAWGHQLDRELAALRTEFDQRSAWAQKMNNELQLLRPQYEHLTAQIENIMNSSSWRLTAPLRRGKSILRAQLARARFMVARLRSALARTRGSLARRGWRATLARIGVELRRDAPVTAHTYAAPSEEFTPFAVPCSDTPQVSVIIPVYNKIAYTAACLRSLVEHDDGTSIEIIVVDDLSSDATAQRLAQVDGLRVVRNEQNLGFVGSCNAGAATARGEFVLFLNNDTLVTAGWLQALLRCFAEQPDAGLVGARLVYPDGRLQEAGGIVFADGSGWNYGRFEQPDDPRFRFRREADYCSGAAIMLRRDLFVQLDGFDTRYAPAYYEDTDLAFAVRDAGLKVYVEPASTVIHFEGITAGTDTGSGVKQYQVINQAKFIDKWTKALSCQPTADTLPLDAALHRARWRVLIIDATTPAPDQDSGSVRMVNMMRVLRDMGCHVSFMADNRAWVDGYSDDLLALGVEVLHHPFVSDPVAWLRSRGAGLDAVILSRHYVATNYVGMMRLYAPRARLMLDTVDLHYLREQRAAELEGNAELARIAATTRAHELKLMRECDLTLVVSPIEQEILAVDAPGVPVAVMSNVHEVRGRGAPFAPRRDLLFVGGFQHPPNIDAVQWFVDEVLPLVLAQLPGVVFHVIGSKMTEQISALASAHVNVHGFVADLDPWLDGCRLSLAPLRYGAGVKGKVNQAMSYGLPVVATSVAVEGMHVESGEQVLVADNATDFAAHIITAYQDEALWMQVSEQGLANVREHFSFDAARTALRAILPTPR